MLSGCDYDESKLVDIELPKKPTAPRVGDLGDNFRTLQQDVLLDNVRKQELRNELRACKGAKDDS